jgi:hypothetical protein
VLGDRAEGGDRPGQSVLGGVLADPVLAASIIAAISVT